MAGTAAGAAKAREAKRAREAATVEPVVRSVSAVDCVPSVAVEIPHGGNGLARAVLDDGAAEAAGYLVRIVRRGGVPHLVRFQAACKVLDLTVNRKQSGTAEPDDSRMAALLDRVASSLAMRRSAAGASDAAVIGDVSGDTETR
jgi:hypothetical protein